MTVQTYAPGTFCWNECATRDADAAVDFYTKLFGWGVQRNEMPGGMGTYNLLQIDGEDIGGLYSMNGPMFEGVPPHWMSYVAVKDVDASAAKAEELGATITAPPMDIPDVGRMAMFTDPVGANLSLYKGGAKCGAAQKEPGTAGVFCWNELATVEPEKAMAFYTKLFGWSAKTSQAGSHGYTEWMMGEMPVGGMLHVLPEWGPIPPHWMSYVSVDDCDAAFAKAKELGASVIKEPEDIPHTGRFACLIDPTGAPFSIFKLTSNC